MMVFFCHGRRVTRQRGSSSRRGSRNEDSRKGVVERVLVVAKGAGPSTSEEKASAARKDLGEL